MLISNKKRAVPLFYSSLDSRPGNPRHFPEPYFPRVLTLFLHTRRK